MTASTPFFFSPVFSWPTAPGGKLHTYQAGGVSPATTYAGDGVTPNTNPVTLDSNGTAIVRLPNATTAFHMVLKDSTDTTTLWDADNYQASYLLSSGSVDSSIITYDQTAAEIAASVTPVNYAYMPGNVLRYGTNTTPGTTDMSAAFQAAANQLAKGGSAVYAPAGTYLTSFTFTSKFLFYGDGSTATILKPAGTTIVTFNDATAAQWSYHSEVRGIGFTNSAGYRTGIGFSFGTALDVSIGGNYAAGYTAGMELTNNVRFFGCWFHQLLKGVQRPYGHIGIEFYSCGMTGNLYGHYGSSNKNYPGLGAPMDCGTCYFFGGEYDSNQCAFYFHDTSGDFGGVSWDNATPEVNNIAAYIYATANVNIPLNFQDTWFEQNGLAQGAGPYALDQWTGTTVSTSNFAPHATILDGIGSYTTEFNGGFFTDCYLKAPASRVIARGCHVESIAGYGGYPCQVDDANSAIYLESPETNGGVPLNAKTFVKGNFRPTIYTITSGSPSSRVCFVKPRWNKLGGSYGGTGVVVNLTGASNLGTGSFNVTAGTASDGEIYGTCNTYSAPFTATNQETALIAANTSLTSGLWYVVTVDVKVTSGTPTFSSWDRGSNVLFANVSIPETGVWYTIAALGFCGANVATFYALDIGSSTAVTAGFEMSAFQIRSFATQSDAQAFLESQVYIGP